MHRLDWVCNTAYSVISEVEKKEKWQNKDQLWRIIRWSMELGVRDPLAAEKYYKIWAAALTKSKQQYFTPMLFYTLLLMELDFREEGAFLSYETGDELYGRRFVVQTAFLSWF